MLRPYPKQDTKRKRPASVAGRSVSYAVCREFTRSRHRQPAGRQWRIRRRYHPRGHRHADATAKRRAELDRQAAALEAGADRTYRFRRQKESFIFTIQTILIFNFQMSTFLSICRSYVMPGCSGHQGEFHDAPPYDPRRRRQFGFGGGIFCGNRKCHERNATA